MSNPAPLPSKQKCTCVSTCARKGRAFPAEWSWQCQQLEYLQPWRSAAETTEKPVDPKRDEKLRQVSLATMDAKLLGCGFVMILPDNSFQHVPLARIQIKPESSPAEPKEHLVKGLASAGSSAAVNPRDNVGESAEPSGPLAEKASEPLVARYESRCGKKFLTPEVFEHHIETCPAENGSELRK